MTDVHAPLARVAVVCCSSLSHTHPPSPFGNSTRFLWRITPAHPHSVVAFVKGRGTCPRAGPPELCLSLPVPGTPDGPAREGTPRPLQWLREELPGGKHLDSGASRERVAEGLRTVTSSQEKPKRFLSC